MRGQLDARSARQQHDAALTRLSNAREAVARLAERLASFDRVREEHELRLAELAAELEASKVVDGATPDRARTASSRREQAAEARERESESRARTAADRSHTLEARAEALQAALDETRARAGVERLAGLPGVLGTLADVVDIDDGCERAFEAAVEDALGTVVVDGTGAARDALRHLHDAGLHGGVLPTGGSQLALPVPGPLPTQLVGRAELLRDRVRSEVLRRRRRA